MGQPILNDILNGYNSTLMAYGQTGSGKTYTIFGSKHSADTGMVPRLVESLFEYITDNPKKAQFRITVSFLQIYMEKITDLLSQNPFDADKNFASNGAGYRSSGNNGKSELLSIREDPKTGIFVHGLTQK